MTNSIGGLGRLYHPDPRDRNYNMFALFPRSGKKLPEELYYETGPVLNQGNTPQCVGYSWKQWLATGPVKNVGPTAEEIYCEAQLIDPFPGDCENPITDGTTVRAGAKALKSDEFVQTYVWGVSSNQVAAWILEGRGPVVVGTNWYASMDHPDPDTGRVAVDRLSGIRGGHAYCLVGYSQTTEYFRAVNSWSTAWGKDGFFEIHYHDLQYLLTDHGEAVTAVEIAQDTDEGLFFPETGKRVREPFLNMWLDNGLNLEGYNDYVRSLMLWGLPLTDAYQDSATGYLTQVFERMVMEWHPQFQPPFRILLRRMGAEFLGEEPDHE